MASYLINGGAHVDRPLSNLAVEAFDGGGDFVAPQLFPRVMVGKQSNTYYVIDKGNWLRVENTRRSRKSSANAGEWQVSSDTYFAHNYAFRASIAKEDISNQDEALNLRQRSARYVTDMINRDREVRVANLVTSISNVGSGASLSGSDKWSDGTSDPISDVNTAHAFIENQTGLTANLMVMDKDTFRTLRYHPAVKDYFKHTGQGPVPSNVIAELFEVERLLVARGVENVAAEGVSASLNNIWGNNAVLARVEQGLSTQAQTAGMTFTWQPEDFPAPLAIERYDDADQSKKLEWVEVNAFWDEKVVASDLIYAITGTV